MIVIKFFLNKSVLLHVYATFTAFLIFKLAQATDFRILNNNLQKKCLELHVCAERLKTL